MKDLTVGSPARQIVLFSLPMLIGNIFQQVYSMVDAIVVGRFVGGTALAAVGVSMSVLQFLLAVLIGLTTGASVVISQFYGAKQYDRLKRTVATSVVFLAALSVAITIFGISGSSFLLRLLDVPDDIFADAGLYLRVLMGGMVFSVFYNMYTAYLRALGDSRTPLYFLICSTILNTALDLLFVIRLGMGVFGVALATIIAQAVAAVLCFMYAHKKVPLLRVSGLIFDKELFRTILKYGTPAALQLSLVTLANLTITRLINSFGASAMAGLTAAFKIDQLATLPISNLSMALSTFIAQNMGAGLDKRAKKGFHSTLIFMLLLAFALSAILTGFGPKLISLFMDQNEKGSAEILQFGLNHLNIMVTFYFLFSFLFGFNGFFRGAGDAVIAMVLPVLSLTVRTLSAYALVNLAGMGPEALAWSIPIGWGLSSLAGWIYYHKQLWVGKTVVKQETA